MVQLPSSRQDGQIDRASRTQPLHNGDDVRARDSTRIHPPGMMVRSIDRTATGGPTPQQQSMAMHQQPLSNSEMSMLVMRLFRFVVEHEPSEHSRAHAIVTKGRTVAREAAARRDEYKDAPRASDCREFFRRCISTGARGRSTSGTAIRFTRPSKSQPKAAPRLGHGAAQRFDRFVTLFQSTRSSILSNQTWSLPRPASVDCVRPIWNTTLLFVPM